MTYRILLVDDEVHAIEGVKSDLDLHKLNISELYTAYSVKKAKEIFEQEKIDILLCDIEMPKGNGLELLAWVREHHPDTATIFLTSHADFKYAKEALRLGSLEYLMKPVHVEDLESAIRNAQKVIDRNSEIIRNSQSHQLWMKHHSLIIEHFWLHLINHTGAVKPAAVREQIERHQIPITEVSRFVPILVSVQRWHKELKSSDEHILEYALRKSAEELLLQDGQNGICFYLDRGMLLIILHGPELLMQGESYLDSCRQFILTCNRYFYCDVSCYYGGLVQAHEMAREVSDLRAMDRNNVAFFNQVFSLGEVQPAVSSAVMPDFSILVSLFKAGKKEAVTKEIGVYLAELLRNHGLDSKSLHQFNQSFMQILYSYLNSKGIQANQLFGDDESRSRLGVSGRSIPDMLAWVEHAIGKALNQTEASQDTSSVIQTVQRYIALNMDQELSRETVAEQVYLHPDHLTRLFKKQTGLSIFEYIQQERIRVAKELLEQTDTPISDVTTSVGYTSFSHFTKFFKKYTGLAPMEYRSQHQAKR